MNQGALDEIYELEEIIASLTHASEEANAEVVAELRCQIERLREKYNLSH